MIGSRFGSGRYRELAVRVTRTKRFSRWVTGFLSLSLGRRTWEGEPPPPGEADATHVMLTIGRTFR